MRLFKIKETKSFMEQLFLKDSFDSFNLVNAVIKTFCTYNIDGIYEKDFFKNSDIAENSSEKRYCKWSELRSSSFNLIKGHNTPLFMKFIFSVDLDILGDNIFIEDGIDSLTLTVRFDDNSLSITSAVNRTNFSPDKTIDNLWDKKAEEILINSSLTFDEES